MSEVESHTREVSLSTAASRKFMLDNSLCFFCVLSFVIGVEGVHFLVQEASELHVLVVREGAQVEVFGWSGFWCLCMPSA